MQIITENSKYYGILLSGGLDSATLLYLLIKENKNIKIQPFTICKKDGSYLYVNKIITYFNNKFELKIPFTISAGDPEAEHGKQNISAAKEIFSKYKIDCLYIAINRNPDELLNYPGVHIRATKSDDPRVFLPFINMTKDKILKILFDDKIEDIIPLTHSCTSQRIGRCNLCWWCKEREWAFSQLNKSDSGVS